LLITPAVAWLAVQPTAASLWTTIALLVIATVLWLAEQYAVKKGAVRAPGPSILVRGFIASGTLMCLAAVVVACLLLAAFGSLRMAGTGMSPTLEPGERLLYHKRVDWDLVTPGAVIVYKNASESAWGQPGWIMISRIIAGPGDKISLHNEQYVVNGDVRALVGETGQYEMALDIPASPQSLTVPENCYFMVQDSPLGGLDSRVLSWARAENIVASRLWYLGRRIGKQVE
jgi:signal peptidase I